MNWPISNNVEARSLIEQFASDGDCEALTVLQDQLEDMGLEAARNVALHWRMFIDYRDKLHNLSGKVDDYEQRRLYFETRQAAHEGGLQTCAVLLNAECILEVAS